MQLKIKKEVTEEITVDLSEPRYFCLLGGIYLEFTEPIAGKPLVRRFSSYPQDEQFDLGVRPPHDFEYEILKGDDKKWNEISRETFYIRLGELLDKFGIFSTVDNVRQNLSLENTVA